MSSRAGWTAAPFAVAACLFVLYPVTRPWADESTAHGAVEAMGSPWWLASHTFAMVGFVLLALGLLGLRDDLDGTPGRGAATAAVVAGWAGAGLALPYYGAETFGLHVMARSDVADPVAFSEAFRLAPLPMTTFGVGLIALAVAGVFAALAVVRAQRPGRLGASTMAAGLVLFLPQFFTPPPVRVAHGVLLGVGLMWLAVQHARAGRAEESAR